MIKLYKAVYVLSVAEEGAFVGGKIAGVRNADGRVLVRIQDLLVLDGLSVFWAAGPSSPS